MTAIGACGYLDGTRGGIDFVEGWRGCCAVGADVGFGHDDGVVESMV